MNRTLIGVLSLAVIGTAIVAIVQAQEAEPVRSETKSVLVPSNSQEAPVRLLAGQRLLQAGSSSTDLAACRSAQYCACTAASSCGYAPTLLLDAPGSPEPLSVDIWLDDAR